MITTLLQGHQAFFLWSNALLNRLLPELIWLHLTVIGNSIVMLAIISIILFYRDHLIKRVTFSAIAISILVQALKRGLNLPRPPKLIETDQFTQYGKLLYDFSFPSGHTATAFFGVIVLFDICKNRLYRFFIAAIGILIGLSRMVLGVHWPIDIIAGAFLSILVYQLMKRFIPSATPSWKLKSLIFLIIILVLINGLIIRPFPEQTLFMAIAFVSCALYFSFKALIGAIKSK